MKWVTFINKKRIWTLLISVDILFCFVIVISTFIAKVNTNGFVLIFGFLPLIICNNYLIGWKYIKKAWYELFILKRLGANCLIFLATQACVMYVVIEALVMLSPNIPFQSQVSTPILFVTLFMCLFLELGNFVNNFLKEKVEMGLQDLEALLPHEALVIKNNQLLTMPAAQVNIGDVVKVKHNTLIPVDGYLLSRDAKVEFEMWDEKINEIYIAHKNYVYAGMRNKGADFLIETRRTVKDNAINRIIYNVNNMRNENSGLQKSINKFLAFFTPMVIIISVLAFMLSYFWLHLDHVDRIETAFAAAIAVLIIASPLAIWLAAPTAILIGACNAIKKGIIFNKPDIFINKTVYNKIIFDKTRTLTKGQIQVSQYYGKPEYLAIVGAFEAKIPHPISDGIQKYLLDHQIKFDYNVKVLDSELLSFKYLDDFYEVIKYSKFKSAGRHPEINLRQTKLSSSLLYKNDNLVAQMIFTDEVREEVGEEIKQLKQRGYQPVLVTGDNFDSALKIANQTGVDDLYANMTPDKKMLLVTEFQLNGDHVIFMGDPLHDLPSLKQADMSIATFTSYNDLNSTYALIILDSRLSLVIDSLDAIHKTKRAIYANLIWACVYNFVFITLALFGLVPPMIAILIVIIAPWLIYLNALVFKFKT